jgi:hypothetical protein
MSTQIKCPYCDKSFEPTEAFKHELEDTLLKEAEEKHQRQLGVVRQETLEKVRGEYAAEARDRDSQNKELRDQMSELLKQNREMKSKDEQREIEFQKRLTEEQDLIKRKAKDEAFTESQLQMAQKDKQLDDLRKQLTEAQRKAEQGSQQNQGEVQELILQDLLHSEFPMDEIKEVPKGVDGADVIQIVRNRSGATCGTIVWESKNTKAWSTAWTAKLKNDQRTLKAELAVIVSKVLPENIKHFGLLDGIWLADLESAIGLACSLRQQLLEIHVAKSMVANMNSKAEVVYGYLTSNEFKQRIEVWVEYFKQRRDEIDKERAYFNKKWEKETRSIQLVFNNTSGIYGDLQGLIGNALPKVSYFELPDEVGE